MSEETWKVTFKISRQKTDQLKHFETFILEVQPDEYVLDAIERVWAFHDRSLVFRHACHHSTCGACGMLVNGVEKLTCVTPIRSITKDGGMVRIEPLRNFPVISDLAVDMSPFFKKMDNPSFTQVAKLGSANLPYEKDNVTDDENLERLVDCIECGMCVSACPSAVTSANYLGPAVLAAAEGSYNIKPNQSLLDLADSQDGAWRCHNAYECTAVCPSNVDPSWRVMHLRNKVIGRRIKLVFGKED
jgi:succinate dehydrogenase/fumarate reductase iron-sulfur protein